MKDLLNILKQKALVAMANAPFDSLAVVLIDFKSSTVENFEIYQRKTWVKLGLYFDLASVSKPLNLASVQHHQPKLFDQNLLLLLSHRAGLPAWAILEPKSWKEVLFSYGFKPSAPLYSDLSALRLMLELEQRSGSPYQKLCSYYWQPELCYWLDLPSDATCPVTGERRGHAISGEVHDPNAYNLKTFCAHAGVFATAQGLGRSLLSMQDKTDFLGQMKQAFPKFDRSERFLLGWDTPSGENSLAGSGCSDATFGHLGFTGTSLWIDAKKQRAIAILSNTTQYAWYEKQFINCLRREFNTLFWNHP